MDHQHAFSTVFCEHCGHTLSVPVYCKNRFCSVCSNHRNRVIRHKIDTLVNTVILRKYDSFKFLTLTVRNNPDLKLMTDELIKAFRMLRQRALWKKHVRGGCVVIEAKKGENGWHVHLHIIIESSFFPVDRLTALWKLVSTGQGVYIKKIHGSQVIGYITKYVTQEKATKAEQENMTVVLKDRRLFQCFGSWFDIVRRIPRMKFPCPACNRVHWFFGSHDMWFRSSSLMDVDYRRRRDKLLPLRPDTQESLIPTMGYMPTIHD